MSENNNTVDKLQNIFTLQLINATKMQIGELKGSTNAITSLRVQMSQVSTQMQGFNALMVSIKTSTKIQVEALHQVTKGMVQLGRAFATTKTQRKKLTASKNSNKSAFDQLQDLRKQMVVTAKYSSSVSGGGANQQIKTQSKWNEVMSYGVKKTKESGKKLKDMTWQMAVLNTTIGPFMAGLDGIMAPFQSLGKVMGAMGSILGTAFLPAVNQINSNFIQGIPMMFLWADKLEDTVTWIMMNTTVIGWWSKATEYLSRDINLQIEAANKMSDALQTGVTKLNDFKVVLSTAFNSVDWETVFTTVSTGMINALKISVDAIQWATSFAGLNDEEKGNKIANALKTLVDKIMWSTAFADVPASMVKGLIDSFTISTSLTPQYGVLANGIVNGIALAIPTQNWNNVASTMITSLVTSLKKGKITVSITDLINMVA